MWVGGVCAPTGQRIKDSSLFPVRVCVCVFRSERIRSLKKGLRKKRHTALSDLHPILSLMFFETVFFLFLIGKLVCLLIENKHSHIVIEMNILIYVYIWNTLLLGFD